MNYVLKLNVVLNEEYIFSQIDKEASKPPAFLPPKFLSSKCPEASVLWESF